MLQRRVVLALVLCIFCVASGCARGLLPGARPSSPVAPSLQVREREPDVVPALMAARPVDRAVSPEEASTEEPAPAVDTAAPQQALPGLAWNFTLVGHSDLGRRGMYAGLALAGECAYVGGRAPGQPVLVVDVADPAAPRVTGAFGSVPGSTARELRASRAQGLLAVLYYRLGAGGRNVLLLYSIRRDCRSPVQTGVFDFGPLKPHEFFLWQDPQRPGRMLAFVAMFATAPALVVVDVSEPAVPREVARWSTGLPATEAVAGRVLRNALHSLSLSPDGRQAYLALWDGGFQVVDTSDFAVAAPRPIVRPLTPLPRRLRYAPPAAGHTHSAVAVPGQPLVLLTDEVYAPACPYGWLRVVDVSDPARPRQVGEYRLPENDPARCAETVRRGGTFSAHNPLALPHLALVSWHAAGLQAIDLSDPTAPRRAGMFVPEPVPGVAQHDPAFGPLPVVTWSYPIIQDGLVYAVDADNGLYILRYTGAWAEEVAGTTFAEGNSNA